MHKDQILSKKLIFFSITESASEKCVATMKLEKIQ